MLKKTFSISENDGNPQAFKALIESANPQGGNYIDVISDATEAKLDLLKELKGRVQVWPIFKKNSKGSEVLSIITNLGLPNGVASHEEPAAEIKPYSVVGGIQLKKDGEAFAYELPEGYVLKRVGEEGVEYTIENGVLKPLKGSADVVLRDTVTHFYKALKTIC